MTEPSRAARSLVVLMFLLSGFAGLIYQVVWVRWLTTYVGGSGFAVSIILTVFMAGLALGSYLAAKYVDRASNAGQLLRAYGWLELGIGSYAVAFPLLCWLFKPFYAALYRQLLEHSMTYNVLSSLLSISLLLVPTTLMGATLPYLSRFYVTSLDRTGTRIGWLYGINTLGAALGALICGFWMIRMLGVENSIYCAIGLNLAIGVLSLLWSRRWESLELTPAESGVHHVAEARAHKVWHSAAAILAVSGFCAMAYEVIWTKLISLMIGPTTYSFTVVLFAFITGLGMGSLLFGWICDRVRSPITLLLSTQMAAAATALLVSQFLGGSQLFFAKLLFDLRGSFAIGEFTKTGVLFVVLLPMTILLGAVFPIAVKICTDRIETVGSSVGRLYTMNTIGALLGAFVAGFVLIPLLGQAASISLLAGGQALVCAGIALWHAPQRATSMGLTAAAGIALAAAATQLPRWDVAPLASAQYHRFKGDSDDIRYLSYWDAIWRGQELLEQDGILGRTIWTADGLNGFVGLRESVNAFGQTNLALSVSGKTDASTMGDMCTETMSAHIPMLLHPSPKKALVIGLASGITAGEMLHYPLEQLDAIEISPEVVRACDAFSRWNNGVLTDPRVRLIVQDARTHMTLSDEMYDVIVSEPSNPWMAGVANLFTREYFVKVHGHLRPQGIFVQWFHTYENDWDAFSVFARSLLEVFPNTILVRTSRSYGDCLFVCFNDDVSQLDFDVAQQNLKYASRSTNVRLATVDVLANLLISERPQTFFSDGPIHTDSHPVLEYMAPIRFYEGVDREEISVRLAGGGELSSATKQRLASNQDVASQIEFAEFLASLFQPPFGTVDLNRSTPEERSQYEACLANFSGHNEIEIEEYGRLKNEWEREVCLSHQESVLRKQIYELSSHVEPNALARCYFALGNVLACRQRFEEAAASYQHALDACPDFRSAKQNLQVACERCGRHRDAAEIVETFLTENPSSPKLLAELAANKVKLGEENQAIDLLDRALKIAPDYAPALIVASTIYGNRQQFERSIELSRRAVRAAPRDARGYANLAVGLYKHGQSDEALRVIDQGLLELPGDAQLTHIRQSLVSAQNSLQNSEI